MSLKPLLLESAVCVSATVMGPSLNRYPVDPKIFVLRNNDLGDLLVATPLFEALRRRFPRSKIIVGVGPWAKDILLNNPYVDTILPIAGPWHNKQVCPYSWNSLQGLWMALRYIFSSKEVQALKAEKCDIGIDVLGSPQGALLMLKAKIPYRLGVHGYAGGHTACQKYLQYRTDDHVCALIQGFASLLGAEELADNRPQLFLTESEKSKGEIRWAPRDRGKKRLLVGPGAGLEDKRWPIEHYVELLHKVLKDGDWEVIICGGKADYDLGEYIKVSVPAVRNLCGDLSLRETFAVTAAADIIFANASMLLHVAAAFKRPTLLLLGPGFESNRKHTILWGYPEPFMGLGRELDAPDLPGPEEAYALLKNKGWVRP